MFAVTAVLPGNLDWLPAFTYEIDRAEKVTAILTLDWTLTWSEESSFVFGTEYSHFRCSL